MSKDAENRAVLAGPRKITLGGREFWLAPLSIAELGPLHEFCRDLAASECQTPLKALAAEFEDLPPVMRDQAMREAIAQSAGAKKVQPTKEAINAKITCLEAVRFLFWLHAKKVDQSVTIEMATELIAETDRWMLIEFLGDLNGPPQAKENEDPKS